MRIKGKKGFTLPEMLIAVGVFAALATVTVVMLNPNKMLQQGRDGKRISDITSLDSYIQTVLWQQPRTNVGNSSVVYVSLVDAASSTCGTLGLPALPSGYTYNCVSSQSSLQKTDGTGWIPINFQSVSAVTLNTLPVDPVNTTSSGLYYTYMTGGSFELTALMESEKKSDVATNDGGMLPGVLQKGSHIDLTPPTRDRGLVGYWTFDEGSGTTARDYSGNERTATLYNSPTWQASSNCKVGGCLSFNGSNNYVKTTSFALTSGADALTYSFWTKNSPQAYTQTFLSDASQSTTVGYIWFYRSSNGGTSQYAYGSQRSSFASSNLFTGYDNQWTHIVVVLDYAKKWGEFYRDGVLVNTQTTTNPLLFPSANRVKYIGSYSTASHFLNGYMDDVRIYNRALSAAEIQAIYNATK